MRKKISGRAWGAALAFVVLSLPRVVHAQTAVTATSGVAFTASADHATVTSYQLDVVASTPTTATGFTRTLGKPTPATTGCPTGVTAPCITVDPIPELGTLTLGAIYTAKVSAISPSGTTASVASDPFTRLVPPPAAPGKPVIVP